LKQSFHKKELIIDNQKVGDGHPVYIVAEIGINHNGDIKAALKLIDAAVEAGCDAVKFQKRSPEICVPKSQWEVIRETPWGAMTYLDYRHRMEFGQDEYQKIHEHCRNLNISWFASCWDKHSVDFIHQFNPDCYKIASACLTDHELLNYTKSKDVPVVLSTGMSTIEEINAAVAILGQNNLVIVHTTSSYSYQPEELNLRMIQTLNNAFNCPVGYSGHEEGRVATIAAVSLGACYIERHITLGVDQWGSDHKISLEPKEFKRLIEEIRIVEHAIGDGVKRVYESEKQIIRKLRNNV